MKKRLTVLAMLLALGAVPADVQAAPASGYGRFLQSLDAITGSAIPIADEQTSGAFPGLTANTVRIAQSLLGSQVVWGGASPGQGFDCSGLVQFVFRQAGVNLPRTADLQYMIGSTVPRTALRPGDLVYFTTYAPGASHVGIYIGAEKFIHTSFSRGVVAIDDMNDEYFVRRYYGAKRLI